MYPLEHFYYGQLVHHGTPTGEMRVLAQSEGITQDHVKLVLRQALLPAKQTISEGSWGILRGNKQAPFLLVQAQIGRAGQTTIHVICLTSDLLRQVAGNIRSLLPLLQKQMPMYEMIGDKLPPVVFAPINPPTADEQVDDLLNLMTFTRNQTRKIEPLLAAVVQNKLLAIQNAPDDNQKRTAFIQGLLTLLPSSTRFAVTFTTYMQSQSHISPQITFVDHTNLDDAVTFDWATGDVGGIDISDDYSRFIVGQLRLDAELSLQQAESLTPVAGWRFRSGDNLREALGYASYRSKLDESILNHLPVSVEEVSKVLSEDPTLNEDLRIAYAQHLMTLSIALEDLSACDPVAITMQTHPELERDILKQLQEAVQNQYGGMVFEMLQRWMDNPLSPQGPEWMDLLRRSTIAQVEDLVTTKDYEGIVIYTEQLQQLKQHSSIEKILPKLIERMIPLTADDTEVANNIFLLALTSLKPAVLQQLLQVRAFTQNLSRPIKRFLSALARPDDDLPPGVLLSVAESFGETNQQAALISLVQLVHKANAYHLIDSKSLQALIDFATSTEGINHAAMLISIYHAASERMATLPPPTNRYLLQIPLAIGRYDLVSQGMVEQSRDYYGGERQNEYVEMVQALFANTPMSGAQAKRALDSISQKAIKGIPFIAACCGALEASNWSVELGNIAQQSSTWLLANPQYFEVIHTDIIIALIRYYRAVEDQPNLKRMVRMLPTVAALKDDKIGLATINKVYQILSEDNASSGLSFELLRQYVREAAERPAKRVIKYFGKTLDPRLVRNLNIAYSFSSFLGRLDLNNFSLSLHETVRLLQNNHESFLQKARQPSRAQMMSVIADLTPRLTIEDRKQFSQDLSTLTQSLFILGKQHQSDSSSSTKVLNALVKGQENPRSALDVLRIAGGHLSRGRAYPLKLNPNVIPNPFSDQDFTTLAMNIGITTDLVEAMARQAEATPIIQWEAIDITDELDSMMQAVPPDRQEILREIGQNLQFLAELIQQIYHYADHTVLEEASRLGKRLDQQAIEPKSVLEMYRFIYSYFSRDD